MVQKMPGWFIDNITDAAAVVKRIIILYKAKVVGIVLITLYIKRCPVLNNTTYFAKTCAGCKSVFILLLTPNTAVTARK